MKTSIFILFSLIIFAFISCNTNGESNYQPDVTFYVNPVRNGKDTLYMHYTSQAGVVSLDTINVGDTVSFKMVITGYTNNLVTYTITQSTDSLTKILLPRISSLDSIFQSTSDYNKGIFNFKEKITSLYFPFKYVALKPGLEAKITFSVISDAKFEYNQKSVVLKTPVLAKKTTAAQ